MFDRPIDRSAAPRRFCQADGVTELNVRGTALVPCGDDPITGFYRDSYCRVGPEDIGLHAVCAVMTREFLEHQVAIGQRPCHASAGVAVPRAASRRPVVRCRGPVVAGVPRRSRQHRSSSRRQAKGRWRSSPWSFCSSTPSTSRPTQACSDSTMPIALLAIVGWVGVAAQ